jgi:hypothetical protein
VINKEITRSVAEAVAREVEWAAAPPRKNRGVSQRCEVAH